MTTLAFSFAALHGSVKAIPVEVCDRIQKRNGEQYVVTHVSDNVDGPVYVCVNMKTGNEAVVLEREVWVHFKHSR